MTKIKVENGRGNSRIYSMENGVYELEVSKYWKEFKVYPHSLDMDKLDCFDFYGIDRNNVEIDIENVPVNNGRTDVEIRIPFSKIFIDYEKILKTPKLNFLDNDLLREIVPDILSKSDFRFLFEDKLFDVLKGFLPKMEMFEQIPLNFLGGRSKMVFDGKEFIMAII